jgi:hypothetical protein
LTNIKRVLFLKQNDYFWKIFKKNNIKIIINYYPIRLKLNKIVKVAGKYPVEIKYKEILEYI